jgi:hypothetical protein
LNIIQVQAGVCCRSALRILTIYPILTQTKTNFL